MTKPRSHANVSGDLRVRGQKLLAAGGPGRRPLAPDKVLPLGCPLQACQIELEMQNEELRRAQATITETGNRYARSRMTSRRWDMPRWTPEGSSSKSTLRGPGSWGRPVTP